MRTSGPIRLSHLINIGLKTERWLNEVDIYTKQQFQQIGPVEAWKRIKGIHPERATDTLLYMLQGALSNIPWSALSEEVREELVVQACSPTSA
jgi:DNA transformation protein